MAWTDEKQKDIQNLWWYFILYWHWQKSQSFVLYDICHYGVQKVFSELFIKKEIEWKIMCIEKQIKMYLSVFLLSFFCVSNMLYAEEQYLGNDTTTVKKINRYRNRWSNTISIKRRKLRNKKRCFWKRESNNHFWYW